MHQVALINALRLICAAAFFLVAIGAYAQSKSFASAMECRMQWDDEFDSYVQQYKKCGPECWSGDARRHEYLRYSDWLNRLEKWHDYCRGMSGAELQSKDGPPSQQRVQNFNDRRQDKPQQVVLLGSSGSDTTSDKTARNSMANLVGNASPPSAWPVSLRTDGQSSCELIRSGEVKYKFQWKEKKGKKCYSNTGVHKNVAACCP